MTELHSLELHIEWALKKRECLEFWLNVLMTMLREAYHNETVKRNTAEDPEPGME